MEMIKNFSVSLYNYINSGFQHVDENTKIQRLEICKTCEKLNSITYQCNECGCFLPIKTSWATERCPLGKWTAASDTIDINSVEIKNFEPEINIQSFENPQQDKNCGCNKK